MAAARVQIQLAPLPTGRIQTPTGSYGNAGPSTNASQNLAIVPNPVNTPPAPVTPAKTKWISFYQASQLFWTIALAIVGVTLTCWTFNLSQWTAIKDFRDDCRSQNATIGQISVACKKALAKSLKAPPVLGSFLNPRSPRAENLYTPGVSLNRNVIDDVEIRGTLTQNFAGLSTVICILSPVILLKLKSQIRTANNKLHKPATWVALHIANTDGLYNISQQLTSLIKMIRVRRGSRRRQKGQSLLDDHDQSMWTVSDEDKDSVEEVDLLDSDEEEVESAWVPIDNTDSIANSEEQVLDFTRPASGRHPDTNDCYNIAKIIYRAICTIDWATASVMLNRTGEDSRNFYRILIHRDGELVLEPPPADPIITTNRLKTDDHLSKKFRNYCLESSVEFAVQSLVAQLNQRNYWSIHLPFYTEEGHTGMQARHGPQKKQDDKWTSLDHRRLPRLCKSSLLPETCVRVSLSGTGKDSSHYEIAIHDLDDAGVFEILTYLRKLAHHIPQPSINPIQFYWTRRKGDSYSWLPTLPSIADKIQLTEEMVLKSLGTNEPVLDLMLRMDENNSRLDETAPVVDDEKSESRVRQRMSSNLSSSGAFWKHPTKEVDSHNLTLGRIISFHDPDSFSNDLFHRLPSQIRVKIHFADSYASMIIPSNISFRSLTDRIDAKLARFTDRSIALGSLRLRYRDEDEELIWINNDEAVQEALLYWHDINRGYDKGRLHDLELFACAIETPKGALGILR